jgi:hypothetical protein
MKILLSNSNWEASARADRGGKMKADNINEGFYTHATYSE